MSDFELRDPVPGDIGWVVQRHGDIYYTEYGWDWGFEGLVAEICGRFIREFDPAREKAWIAWRGDERIGCVFLVRNTYEIAQLRLLLVEPSARGLGLGRALVKECVDFAVTHRYRKVRLWTQDCLHSARRIYEAAGFQLIESKPHHSWGFDLVSQTWELELTARTAGTPC
jgi:GNAT superfamily N-acetyltransferase